MWYKAASNPRERHSRGVDGCGIGSSTNAILLDADSGDDDDGEVVVVIFLDEGFVSFGCSIVTGIFHRVSSCPGL